ncbi:MAG: o-succinylbenzoate--CoA ligase [Thermomicrobiales bacterium]
MIVPDPVASAASLFPATDALRFGGACWTYRELEERVQAAAALLAARHRGGRVGVLSASRPGVVFAAHACARLGAPFVPHGWRLTADELAWQLTSANVTTLLHDPERAALAGEAARALGIETVPLDELESAPPPESAATAPPSDLLREAAVLFTSGTTGRPKGARIIYGNLWHSAVASALLLDQQPGDIWLATLSLHHIGGLSILYRAAIGGCTVDLHERFDADTTLQSIRDGAGFVSLVPTMLQRLLDHPASPTAWPESLRAILLGGAATPAPLLERAMAAGLPVLPTYGLTETSSQAATLFPDEISSHPGSSGTPLPTTEIRIMHDGNPVAPGVIGGIEVRGPAVFAGYLDEPLPRDPAAWFPTGDDGYLDADGFLYVVDRRTDLIVSGGENIYPAEIERVLLTHPNVTDAGVAGVSDTQWGARPAAAVVWQGEPRTAQATLQAYCRAALASFKAPDHVLEVAALPRSPGGKLLRREVRAMFEDPS